MDLLVGLAIGFILGCVLTRMLAKDKPPVCHHEAHDDNEQDPDGH